MGYFIDPKWDAWLNFHRAWHDWAHSKPSPLKHPFKYIKWYFSEPKYEDFRKETNNGTTF